jgi:aminoglycoside phosphotransferase family enzyme/predicted kinase
MKPVGPPDSERLVAFLAEPSSYPDRPGSVEVVETHISWVFLTDRYAYKLKKPVTFEFLDFSTPGRRRQACLEELRCNRRLAPDVYLDVLPLTHDDGGAMALGGGGTPIDWIVRMRRLAAAKALDVVLQSGRLTKADSRAIADLLICFYAGLPSEQTPPAQYRQRLDDHLRANGADLLADAPEERARVRRILGAQLRFLAVQAELFEKRVAAGRIVDGHGDLRPEHIYLEDPPAVIDGIEFSAELRQVDIADELSFLAMECRRLGDGGLGELILATYQIACGDKLPPPLLAFYRSYRACVRAKVALLRDRQQPEDRHATSRTLVRQYLDGADRDAAELGPPALIVIGGLPGTGKSMLAQQIADAYGAELLSTDQIRRAMYGVSPSPAGYGDGLYQPEMRARVYDELHRLAGEMLRDGRSVVLDGNFPARRLRNEALDVSRRAGAVALHVLCECPRETALARIEQRRRGAQNESEARAELYDRHAQEFEAPGVDESIVAVDTTHNTERQMRLVCDELKRLMFA